MQTSYGVSQGSIQGPVLFSMNCTLMTSPFVYDILMYVVDTVICLLVKQQMLFWRSHFGLINAVYSKNVCMSLPGFINFESTAIRATFGTARWICTQLHSARLSVLQSITSVEFSNPFIWQSPQESAEKKLKFRGEQFCFCKEQFLILWLEITQTLEKHTFLM